MKNFKLFAMLFASAAAMLLLLAWHKQYKPVRITFNPLPEVPPLPLDAVGIFSSKPKDMTLEEIAIDNILSELRRRPPPEDGKNIIPAPETIDDLVRVCGISIIAGTRGALLELKGAAAVKPSVPGKSLSSTAFKPKTGATAATDIKRVETAPETSATGQFVPSRYYVEGSQFNLPKGIATLSQVHNDSVVVVYLDKEFALSHLYDWKALNSTFEQYKKVAEDKARRETHRSNRPPQTEEERRIIQEMRTRLEEVRAKNAAAGGSGSGNASPAPSGPPPPAAQPQETRGRGQGGSGNSSWSRGSWSRPGSDRGDQ